MQTTLLGIAIAFILALATALVGPMFVDWGQYRSSFEAEASRLIGVPVRVAGDIDLRLLPTPILHVRDVSVGPEPEAPTLRIKHLGVELALGNLMRGELRASRLDLNGPELRLAMDQSGKLDVPGISMGFDPESLAIEQLRVDNARVVLTDRASGSVLRLEQLSFTGDLRSLAGPLKGEGGFVTGGQLYGYRLATNRRAEDGGTKLRVSLDPVDRPLAVETEGTVYIEGGVPRFDGALTLARPAGMVLQNGRAVSGDPWRITSRLRASSTTVLFEGAELQYGPEDRMVRLAGTADVKFRASRPRLEAVLSARQLDLDRLVSVDGAKRPPIAVLQSFADRFADAAALPFPLRIGIGVDSLAAGGAALQSVRGDFSSEADAWAIDTLEFRAPGATQIRLSGRFKTTPRALEFTGPASINSIDPKALAAWVEGNADGSRAANGIAAVGPLAARGDVTFGSERIAVERLRAEIDRKTFEGRIAYAYAAAGKAARIDAALSAAELDVDRAVTFARAAFAGTSLDWPGEIALSLKIAKASVAGVEVKAADADVRYDSAGLVIQRLAIADLGGVTLQGSGRIDTNAAWSAPRGTLLFTIDAARLDGAQALLARIDPAYAEALRGVATRLVPAKVEARLDVSPAPPSGPEQPSRSLAAIRLSGQAGAFKVKAEGAGQGHADALRSADLNFNARLDSDDGAALAQLIGLEPFVSVDRGVASVSVQGAGRGDGDMRVDARLSAAGLETGGSGTLRWAEEGPRGAFDLDVNATRVKLSRRDPAPTTPVAFKAKASLAGGQFALSEVRGQVAGVDVKGRVAIALGKPARVDGQIEVADIDAGALVSLAAGLQPKAPARRSGWSQEPFTLAPAFDIDGRLDVTAATASLTPGLVARAMRTSVRFEPSGLSFDDIDAGLVGGKLTGALSLRNGSSGLAVNGRFKLTNGDAGALFNAAGKSAVAGRAAIDFTTEGSGLSPAALLGDLRGSGTVTIDNAQLSGLNPRAVETVVGAVDRGLAIEQTKVADAVSTALDAAPLRLASASGNVALSGGRLFVARLPAQAEGVDLTLSGSYDLNAEAVDARIMMLAPLRTDASIAQRGEISVLFKGPAASPRRSVDATPLMTWLTLRAVEQEQKRLEAAEAEAKRLAALEVARRTRERAERERLEREKQEREKQERERVERERIEREQRDATALASPGQDMSSTPNAPASSAPALPPAVEVKPAPRPRTPARAAPPRPSQAETPPPPPALGFPFFQFR